MKGVLKKLGKLLLILFGGLTGLATLLFFFALISELRYQPEYNYEHPDYERFAREFERIRKFNEGSSYTGNMTIDFSQLASGRWRTICLFGGYTNPLKTAEERGWGFGETDRDRLEAARHRGFRNAIVEEFEVLIAYVIGDFDNGVEFIHFKDDIGAMGQHLQSCISKPETKMDLAPFR